MSLEHSLLSAIASELAPSGFESRAVPPSIADVEVVCVWARKTWNTNRAVAVLRAPPNASLGPLSQSLKIELGKAIGYFPFFYGIGLQIVWLGHGIVPLSSDLGAYVDKIDNQRSIIQSLFVVDLDRRTSESARTWGQVITGKFQDAIERGIGVALAF